MKLAEALMLRADMNKKIASLTERINGNCKVQDGKTMMEALAERDRITKQHAILKSAASSSRNQGSYYSNSEIKWKAVMKVDGLEKQADDISKKLRELNTSIQAANWASDLPD